MALKLLDTKIKREYLPKVKNEMKILTLVLPETLKGLTAEYEELKKDSLQENVNALIFV